MSRLLTYFLVFGVFAGLWGRVLAMEAGFDVGCVEVSDCCDSHDGHDEPSPDEEHGPECPSEPHGHHHHQASCCFSGVLAADDGGPCRLAVPTDCRTTLSFGSVPLPDGPVLSMDKPPLI